MFHTQIHHIAQLALPLLLLSGMIAGAAEVTPPVAPTVDHREERHGATVVDNYYWLREKSNPKVVAYLEAENAYTEAMTADLAPFQDALYKEMLGRVKQTDLTRSRAPRRLPVLLAHRRRQTIPDSMPPQRQHGSAGRDPAGFERTRQVAQVRRAGHFRGQRRSEHAGLHHRFHGLPPVRTAGEESAHRRDAAGYHRARGLRGMGGRQPDALPDHRGRRHQAVRQTVAARAGCHRISSRSTTRRTSCTISAWRKRATRNISFWRSTARTPPSFATCARTTRETDFAVFLPREKKHRYYVDHRENLFYIRTNKDWPQLRHHDRAGKRSGAEELEGLHPAAGRCAARGHRPVSGFRRLGGTIASRSTTCACMTFATAKWTADSVPRTGLRRVARRHARVRIRRPIATTTRASSRLPASYDYDVRSGQSTLLKRQEVLGGYDPTQYVSRAPVGHRARRREGAGFDRLPERIRARRPRAAVPLRLWLLRHSARPRPSPATA